MKSSHKHELQTNELADALGRAIIWAKPHGGTIAMVAAGVIVVVFVLVVLPVLRGGAGHGASAEFAVARNAGDAQTLRDFLDDYPNAPQAPTARLLLADRLLREAVSKTKPDGDLLVEARKRYAEVDASSELLRPLAKVGLALVTVQEGDLDKGRAGLQEVVSTWPQSVGAEKARSHIEALAGYKPLVFSNEPLEEPKTPDEGEAPKPVPKEGATAAPEPKQAQGNKVSAPEAETKTPDPEAKPAPKATDAENKQEKKTKPEPAGD